MTNSLLQFLRLATAFSVLAAAPLAAQTRPKKPAVAVPQPVVGTWVGTATVPLADSAIVVPVFYTFAQGPDGITGTAMVPGQGTGPISDVVRDGPIMRFRVTTTKGVLEHDGKFNSDGAIEGIVILNKLPVARFKIALKK